MHERGAPAPVPAPGRVRSPCSDRSPPWPVCGGASLGLWLSRPGEAWPTGARGAAGYVLLVQTSGTFQVISFEPTTTTPAPPVETALPVSVSRMEKRFEGGIVGRSATLFTAAYDQTSGVGTYVAMESFEGLVDGRTGSLNFVHSATMSADRSREGEFFTIVPGSGTGELTTISGSGGIAVDADGTHRIWLDYNL